MITIVTLVTIDILFGFIKKVGGAESVLDGSPVILLDHGIPLLDKMKKVDVFFLKYILVAATKSGDYRIK